MEWIDRYVIAVTERLPEDTREDVAKELRTNIEDMLPEDATESDVRVVLEKLGNPVTLSNEYRQEKKYLIGPALYDNYFSVLKLVVGIAVVVFIFLSLLGIIAKPINSEGIIKFTTDFSISLLSAAMEGAVQAFLWVTVVFVILERTGVSEGKLPFGKKKWTVDDLQTMSISGKERISRGEPIASFICTIIFTALFIFQPQLIGWYEGGENGLTLIAPVFQINHLQVYIPAIILLAVIQFSISAYKFISMRWTLPLAIVNTLNNLALSILTYFMLSDKSLFSMEFISHIADVVKMPLSQLTIMWQRSISVFITIFVLACALDSVMGFVKCRKLSIRIK